MKSPKQLARSACLLLAFPALAFTTGCATLSARAQQESKALAAKGVEPELAHKVVAKQPIEIEEIIRLNSHGVENAVITEAIKNSRTAYQLTSADIERLQRAEVDRSVIDALLATPHQTTIEHFRYRNASYGYPTSRRGHCSFHPGHRSFSRSHHHGGYHRYRRY